jgi:hypothetical protein
VASRHHQVSKDGDVWARSNPKSASIKPAAGHFRSRRPPRLNEDLYLNFGGMSDDNQRAVIQAYVNPLVSWIWIGGLVLIGGTLVCLVPSKVKMQYARTEVVGITKNMQRSEIVLLFAVARAPLWRKRPVRGAWPVPWRDGAEKPSDVRRVGQRLRLPVRLQGYRGHLRHAGVRLFQARQGAHRQDAGPGLDRRADHRRFRARLRPRHISRPPSAFGWIVPYLAAILPGWR